MESMRPQPFCSYCGASYGEPHKTRIVDGERLTYPAMIDAHHVYGQKRGSVVYICHACHMAHHDGRHRLILTYDEGWLLNGRRLRIADACETA